MAMIRRLLVFVLVVSAVAGNAATVSSDGDENGIRIKELCRLAGNRDNSLVGYGIITGLSGTGDSLRSESTLQSLSNILTRFGVHVAPAQIRTRNAAAVMVTATLPAFARPGDRLDANITSIGDARSLLGGTLLLTHLTGADGKIYALSQGPISVGGYAYDYNGNLVQKNHPTTGYLAGGATVEKAVEESMLSGDNTLEYVLFNPDFTTAGRIAKTLNGKFEAPLAKAIDASRVRIQVPNRDRDDLVAFITDIESTVVNPDRRARVVINERTGTVVAGENVRISAVSVTHGDIKVVVNTEFLVSQPAFLTLPGRDVQTAIVPRTELQVSESDFASVSLRDGASVADLVAALNKARVSSRDVITILQAIRSAGALHAELVIQ